MATRWISRCHRRSRACGQRSRFPRMRRAAAADGSDAGVVSELLLPTPLACVNGVTRADFSSLTVKELTQAGIIFFLPFFASPIVICRQPTTARPHTRPRLRQGLCQSATHPPRSTMGRAKLSANQAILSAPTRRRQPRSCNACSLRTDNAHPQRPSSSSARNGASQRQNGRP